MRGWLRRRWLWRPPCMHHDPGFRFDKEFGVAPTGGPKTLVRQTDADTFRCTACGTEWRRP